MSTPTRLYLVAGPKGDRLVEATTGAAAVNHCVRSEYSVEPANPKLVAKLVGAGTKVEIAGEKVAPVVVGPVDVA